MKLEQLLQDLVMKLLTLERERAAVLKQCGHNEEVKKAYDWQINGVSYWIDHYSKHGLKNNGPLIG